MSSLATTPRDTATRHAAHPAPPFTATLASEWTKLVSVRSTWITLALALGISTGVTALVSWATGWSWNEWSAADRAAFDPLMNALVGSILGAILFIVLGVNLVAAEYSSGMIRQTFAVTPRRGRVLLAKVLVISAVSIVASLIVCTAMFITGQAVFAAWNVPTTSLTDGETLRTLALVSLTAPVLPILGVCAAFIVRSAAVAITVVLAITFAPSFFGGLLPLRWQENVLAWLPGQVADSIAIGHLMDGPLTVSPGPAVAALAIWLVVIIGGTRLVLERRDV